MMPKLLLRCSDCDLSGIQLRDNIVAELEVCLNDVGGSEGEPLTQTDVLKFGYRYRVESEGVVVVSGEMYVQDLNTSRKRRVVLPIFST